MDKSIIFLTVISFVLMTFYFMIDINILTVIFYISATLVNVFVVINKIEKYAEQKIREIVRDEIKKALEEFRKSK